MTRFIIEELCEHGADQPHHDGTGRRDVVLDCPGGSRLVFDGIPEELIERAAEAIGPCVHNALCFHRKDEARRVLESVFGEKEKR